MSILIGCMSALLAVITGAFGAHGLKNSLGAYGLEIWHTAASYQMVHSLALILLGLFEGQKQTQLKLPRSLFLAGIVLFSGSLYALALTDMKILGAITPLGGLSFMGGWLAFGWKSVSKQKT